MTATLSKPAPQPSTPLVVPPRPRRRRLLLVVLVAALALGLTLGVRAVVTRAHDVRSGTTAVSVQEFAAHTGVRITLLGVTAQGGMIEFRYQVVDPDKASLLLHDESMRPVLVAEDSGQTLAMVSRPHNHKADLKVGGSYFFLMANTRNAIRDGTPVTIVVDDVRLEHVVARS
jgi:hypothetical protein